MSHIHRLLSCAAAAACVLSFAACGGGDSSDSNLPGPTPTTLTPEQTQDPNLPSVDGYLMSASTDEVVLRTGDGDQKFTVAAQDLPALGIEHLASHAGLETLGFRVYYKQQGDKRFVKRADEIPPPPLRPAE